ncbi:hypothetical protein [Thermovirga sp.]|uniref:hypothetical protein n=1 Tax=Thermovirga sp. TaxID=2699834 RepID=UPI0025F61766|nr:hypothetical protein [Thermovirga sp.]
MTKKYSRKITRENVMYMVLASALFISGYFYLRYAYKVMDQLPFSQEIVLIILGTIITVLITALLLNKQTEVELRKEESIKFLELKSSIYLKFLDHLEHILLERSASEEDMTKLRFLTHKLAIVASPDVLHEYQKFVEQFIRSTKDKTINPQESDEIAMALAKLTTKIREDLLREEDASSIYSTEEISDQILDNMEEIIEESK